MGVRFPSVVTNTLVNAVVGINTETIVCTTPPLTLPLDFATVILLWEMVHGVGTTAAQTRYRIRRGTTVAGAIVDDTNVLTAAAGNSVFDSGCAFDVPGAVAGQQYTLTCIDVGSTANGGITEANLIAFAL